MSKCHACRHCPTILTDETWYSAHRKAGRKICKTCHTNRESQDTRRVRQQNYVSKMKKDDPEGWKRRLRRYRTKHLYGLTEDQLHALYAKQDGRCALCRHPEGEKSLCVDHDHRTGEVRGLLCNSCNTLLGYAKESTEILRAAIYYLIDPPK